MASLFDYLDWRGDLRFSDVGVNEVDNLIFSQISYIDFADIVPSDPSEDAISLQDAMRQYLRRHRGEKAYLGKLVPSDILSLSAKAAKCRRFSSVKLCGYVNDIDKERQTQFSAITFRLESGIGFVAYRGTDDTLVGWKENFNMSFLQPVPAQRSATEYLERIAAALPEHALYAGGHSKGGNLAVYAAVTASPSVKERLLSVFNNDGPGFSRDFIDSIEYRNISGKIRTIVPQSSVVGMLLEHEEVYEVVKSNASGLLQHNAFSWEVLGGAFIHLDTVSGESKLLDSALKEWLGGMSVAEREEFVDSLYETLSATDAKTLTELTAEKLKLVKAWGNLGAKERSVLLKCISLLLRPNLRSVKKDR